MDCRYYSLEGEAEGRSMERTDTNFESIWETHQLGARTMTMQATQTLVPSDSVLESDYATIPDLPRILSASDSGSQLKVVGEIGRGGMGVIRLGRQIALRREVAIKQVREDRRSKRAANSLTTEGLLVGALEHPNIVPVYLLGEDDDGFPTLVMKRIDGVSWGDVIHGKSEGVGPAEGEDPLEWHLEVLMQVSNAVHFAHSRGIVHRDLKPENVMVGAFGEVYLLDWGIAVTTSASNDSPFPKAADVKDVAGTPAYMSPEMVTGNGAAIGPRTDVYLLGAILHEIVTGSGRHQGDSMFAVMHSAYESAPLEYPGIEAELGRICNRATAKDPADRFESADEFRRAVATFLRHRESIKFAARAAERARALDELLAEGGDSEAIYATFQKALFTFDAALEAWSGNDAASEGRAALLDVMFEHEVEAEDARGARRILALMQSSSSVQADEVARLESLSADRTKAAAELERLKFDRDVRIMGKWRATIHLDIGLFWFGAIFFYLWKGADASHWWTVAASLCAAVSAGSVLWWKRELFLPNEVGRQLVASYGLSLAMLVLVHSLVALSGAPVHLAFIFDAVAFSSIAAVVAVTLDRAMVFAALGLVAVSVVAAAFAEHAVFIVAGGVGIVQVIVAGVDFWVNGRAAVAEE